MTSQEKKKTPDLTKLLLTVFLPGLSFHTESMYTYCHHLECLWWSLHQGIPSQKEEKKQSHVHISVKNSSVSPGLSTITPPLPPPIKKYSVILFPYEDITEDNKVKNPNWQEANQLSILQASPRIWTRDYRGQIHLAVSAGLELGDFGEKKNLGTLFCCSSPKYKCAANTKNIHWSTLQFNTWEQRRKLVRVSLCKDFWDRYWEYAAQLEDIFFLCPQKHSQKALQKFTRPIFLFVSWVASCNSNSHKDFSCLRQYIWLNKTLRLFC